MYENLGKMCFSIYKSIDKLECFLYDSDTFLKEIGLSFSMLQAIRQFF